MLTVRREKKTQPALVNHLPQSDKYLPQCFARLDLDEFSSVEFGARDFVKLKICQAW